MKIKSIKENPAYYLSTLAILLVLLCGSWLISYYSREVKVRAAQDAALMLQQQVKDNGWDFIARYLAGIAETDDPEKKALLETKAYHKHAETLSRAWPEEVLPEITTLQEWRGVELPEGSDYTGTVFYPFSGPDFLYISAVFPRGSEYYLFGLEEPGSPEALRKIPDHPQDKLFGSVQGAMDDIINFSFFKTKDMKKDLSLNILEGTSPIILVFMAVRGYQILDLRSVMINQTGSLVPALGDGKDKGIYGIEIDLIDPKEANRIQKVYYFSVNISDFSLQTKPWFIDFIAKKRFYTYLKAASYLMHKDYFSKIRNTILNGSDLLIQDDSGIPIRYFDRSNWDISLYGSYTKPINLFKDWFQEDLYRNYSVEGAVKPLPLGIGYNYRDGHSNLMIARKKVVVEEKTE